MNVGQTYYHLHTNIIYIYNGSLKLHTKKRIRMCIKRNVSFLFCLAALAGKAEDTSASEGL